METDQALALYDDPIRASRSTEWLDVVDAAALLWRLSLFGVDVTARARQLASDIAPLLDQPVYIFNDWHAVMALSLAGDRDGAERLVAAAARADHRSLGQALVAERFARKPTSLTAARRLLAENSRRPD